MKSLIKPLIGLLMLLILAGGTGYVMYPYVYTYVYTHPELFISSLKMIGRLGAIIVGAYLVGLWITIACKLLRNSI